jgi:hypothetical protein
MAEHQSAAPAQKPPATNVSSLTPPAGGQKKEATGAKPPKEPKTPKEPKVPRESNFKKLYPDNATVTLLTDGGKNPKREGSASYDRFAVYKNGISVGDALKGGVTYADLSWDVGHGFIKVTAPTAA